ncbi:hypothetical protein JK386_12610 [Nocardioides sp. zg-536]|uniref:Lipoprotein n=1 Tax=Nocardioides faecalis TaxID=2803858 RepID=A0A938Y9T0_9ACTN|nr:hypothetical protein [Nocardioides faecalis]MBM9460748.1 hypothetical protein [Nocardioides faecalis]MBS4752687.1 hypothetical protein [Nocardioides faecalis]QVI57945.1 hypothetical protein KG111_12985 [Nocardioides faecalis]
MMKRTLIASGLLALLSPLLAGCADPSRADDAEDLRSRLADLPGVSAATLKYADPALLDSGKVGLTVHMESTADADAVVEVVTTAYDAFTNAHRREEGDLDVLLGEDTLHLRSFSSEAGVEAVREATVAALPALDAGVVWVDINTQDQPNPPHVHTQIGVTVDASTPEGLILRVQDLAAEHGDIPHTGWSVGTVEDGGWRLSSSEGLPAPAQRARLRQLAKDLPEGSSMWLDEDDAASVDLPADLAPEAVSDIAGRHLRLLGAERAWYDVVQGETFLASFAKGECTFDTGPAGALLERQHGEACTSVTHPDPD